MEICRHCLIVNQVVNQVNQPITCFFSTDFLVLNYSALHLKMRGCVLIQSRFDHNLIIRSIKKQPSNVRVCFLMGQASGKYLFSTFFMRQLSAKAALT